MRDRETIDSELRRAALRRQSMRKQGRQPSSHETDQLLDELLAHSAGAFHTNAVTSADMDFVPEAWTRSTQTRPKARRRSSALRRWCLLAALPMSLVAVFAAVVVVFALRQHDSASQSADAQSKDAPPSAAPAKPMSPIGPIPRINIVDAALVETLKNEGVPVPSQDYVTSQGHAVCDFLARQPNFEDALKFVQGSTIWDASQSTNVIAGAIVSYCPQSQPSIGSGLQQAYQNTFSDEKAIEGKLHDFQGDLKGIQGVIDGLPGHQ
ncbi:DUF732 domain-containing protein [Mycobacterium shigaense]|nr:DUF732 domain-containing protein [Mycobacterium shigaense]MEA1122819.1 DUF732 domain-containing protein [Mycobacterium shigaense]PRI14794.1 hypothetical protein B2J96_09855 [Mycobacterium shigaense]